MYAHGEVSKSVDGLQVTLASHQTLYQVTRRVAISDDALALGIWETGTAREQRRC